MSFHTSGFGGFGGFGGSVDFADEPHAAARRSDEASRRRDIEGFFVRLAAPVNL